MSGLARKLAIVLLWFVLVGAAVILLNPGDSAGAQEGEAIPTAEACGAPTLESSFGNVNVRSGPGLEYTIIGTIATFEVRPVVGRAGFAQWWLIELEGGVTGWVVNDAVTIQGDIAALPVVDTPALADGTIPTPGPAWIPVVNALCAPPESTETEASADNADEWAVPVNLSRSGASGDPRMVIDSNGLFHVLWQDTVDGFVYAQGNGSVWSEPAATGNLPFWTRIYYPDLNETEETPLFVPQLVADRNGNIHAFWIDDENGLYYSSVAAEEFTTFSAWRTRQTLAPAALQLDVSMDVNGFLHLAYVRPTDTEEAPAGVYYRQSVDDGEEWSDPVPVYRSRYFHSTAKEEVNIDIATNRNGETDQVFIAWDNRPLGRVLAARSGDGGLTWDQPFLVDGRELEDVADAVNPGHISVGALGDQVMLVWQAGHTGETCSQYYRWSSDGGETWEPRQAFGMPRGCHLSDQFLATQEGNLILLAIVDEVVGPRGYLMAWDGEKWSEPQEQTILTTFENPETYLEITYQCHQVNMISPNTVIVVGCDGGVGKDIWLTRRVISGIEDWFPPPPIWEPPTLVGVQPGIISSLNLQADADGLLHVIWARNNEEEIFYSNQNNLFWTQPAAITRALEGSSGQPVTALDNEGHIFVVWSGIDSGQIYFSSAETARTLTPADWSPAQVVSEPGLVAQSPQIVVDRSGVIYVAYAVPLNEERGIYLVRSEDGGTTWTPTVKVFDGVAAGWAIVDRPQLAATAEGGLHILLSRYQNLNEARPLAIFYTRSENSGESWAAPLLVAEQPVITGDLFGFGLQTLHRLWFNEGNSGLDVWHDLSIDGGRSWDEATSATGFGQVDGPMSFTADAAGRLHLLGVNGPILQHWIWESGGWIIEAQGSLATDTASDVYALGATIATNGDLAAVFAAGDEESTLYYTGRALALPDFTPEPIPTTTPTPQPTATATATSTPMPTPTVVLPTEVPAENGLSGGGSDDSGISLGVALSFLPAMLLVGVAFYFGLRAVRRAQR
jgi:uncharacterized protein YraI